MTKPDAQPHGSTDLDRPAEPAFSVETMTKRRDFLAAARAKRQHTKGFVLQARKRSADETHTSEIRIGYTCSKKVGNAVARNRAKRRLREIARQVLPIKGKPGYDYVLIGRNTVTAERNFEELKGDLRQALSVMHPAK